jgi:hypothetical protein
MTSLHFEHLVNNLWGCPSKGNMRHENRARGESVDKILYKITQLGATDKFVGRNQQ